MISMTSPPRYPLTHFRGSLIMDVGVASMGDGKKVGRFWRGGSYFSPLLGEVKSLISVTIDNNRLVNYICTIGDYRTVTAVGQFYFYIF